MRDLSGRILKAPVLNKRSTGALVAKGSCEFLATSPSPSSNKKNLRVRVRVQVLDARVRVRVQILKYRTRVRIRVFTTLVIRPAFGDTVVRYC